KMSTRVTTGKHAVTHYYVKERFKQYTYVECILETGRTHQIRVHMSSIGHPLLGDSIYGNTKDKFHLQGQTLHAKTIGFVHPRTNQYMEFETPLPAYFDELLDQLRQS
ncbi:MAG: RNA pseudouridine synthase, partial [Clostridia bacterium]|nr:RNA pseudouridine synthase [Clostridia bacterium]